MRKFCLGIIALLFSQISNAQKIQLTADNLLPNKVYMTLEKLKGSEVVKVIKDSTVKEADEATFVKINNLSFSNGVIEVEVLSKLRANASPNDRGFIGLAFRINDNNTKFESIYLRPTNGRADDQLRRNHSIQYFSFPDYKFDRLRKESPEKYESYADMELNKWIKLRVVVNRLQAKLYLNNNPQPSLIVNDLKHGADALGGIGLFVDVGTEGYFRNLKILTLQDVNR